jgi:hypothetical protein
MIDVETTAVPSLVMADLAVEARFSLLQRTHFEVPANAVAGLLFVAAVLEATLPCAVGGVRWMSFELANDVVVSTSGPFRCLCFVVVQSKD